MFEAIIYNTTKNIIPISIYMTIIFVVSLILWILTRKFNIHNKLSQYCGLLCGLNNRQILRLSAILIRNFLIIYSLLIYNRNIEIYLIMIILAELVYIILTPQKALFEIINNIAQLICIYLINVLKTYQIEISNEAYITQIEIVLKIFMIIYTTYFFLRNFEETIAIRRKELEDEKR